MASQCAISPGARFLQCGGRMCNIDPAFYSIVFALVVRTTDAALNNIDKICNKHFIHFKRLASSTCLSPNCSNLRDKVFYPVAKQYNIYLNVDEQAKVFMHRDCYSEFKNLIDSSPSPNPDQNNSNNNNNNDNNNSNSDNILLPLSRTAEIATHEYLTAKQSITPPGSPIQTNGKRGRSKTWHHIPRSDKNYKDCSPPSKHQKVQAAKSFIKHLTHNNSGTEEGNRENRISFLTDLINSDKENFFPAIERSQFRTQAFKLTSDQTIELRNKINLTWNQQRLLRSYLKSINRNILPPEYTIRNQQTEYEYQFEADTVKLNNDLITYVRVSDPVLLIQQQLAALKANNQLISHDNLIPENEIWLNLLGDKGGHSTKLMVSILNTVKPLSRNQILLALYEGAGEEYDIVKLIFGPIFDRIYTWARNYSITNIDSYGKIQIFVGGDMMYLWMLHGLSQCGTHFCVYCRSKDRSNLDELRDYNHHMEQLQLFNNAGRVMNTAQQYFNCINEPIIGENAFINTAPMPLHTFLGVGQLCLEIMRSTCIELDKRLIDNGLFTNNNNDNNNNNETDYDKLYKNIDQCEHELEVIELWLNNIYQTIYGNSESSVLDDELESLKTRVRQLEEEKIQINQSIQQTLQQLKSAEGYFLHKFNQFLLSIKVIRKGNYGHSLVGSEVHALFEKENIIELTNIIRSQIILTKENKNITFGENAEADKLQQLMEIIAQLYNLCTAARKLEPDEIETIKSQAKKLLEHYKTNYPNRSITPKLHNLIHHFPVLAETHQTIGLLSEHAIESMHRRFKLYDSTYCSIRDPIKQLLYCIRLHTLAIDARLASKKMP